MGLLLQATLVVGAAQALLSCWWWFHLQGWISWAVN